MADTAELVRTILARTRDERLSWEELSATGFLARVGQTMIIVQRSGGYGTFLRITDEAGKLIDTIQEPGEVLSELYELARRQALKVDEALSDLKRNLEKL